MSRRSERDLAREVAAPRMQRGLHLLELPGTGAEPAAQGAVGPLPVLRARTAALRDGPDAPDRAPRSRGAGARVAPRSDQVREPARLRARGPGERGRSAGRRCRPRAARARELAVDPLSRPPQL